MSKDGVVSGPYFPVFGLNTGKYELEITPYLDTFHAVNISKKAPITSKLLSNDLDISWVIATNLLTQESPGLNSVINFVNNS